MSSSILLNDMILIAFLFFTLLAAPVFAQSPIVSSLKFEGNQAVGKGDLKLLMATRAMPWYHFLPWAPERRFIASVFAADLQRVRTHYQGLGYLSVVVDTSTAWSENRVRLTVRIEEGEVTRVRAIDVSGLPDEPVGLRAAILKKTAELSGQPLARQEVGARLDFALRQLRNNGYAFARVDVETLIEDGLADVAMIATPGPLCMVGALRVSGNVGVAGPTVLRGMTIRPGDTFSEAKLRDSQRQLYRAGVFRSVTLEIPEDAAHVSPVDVVVQVSERPFRSVKLGVLYDTEEQVRVSAEWAHRNLWGDARQVRASGALSRRAREAVISLRQPYVYSSRNWVNLSGFVQRTRQSDFEQDEAGSNIAFERNIGQHANLVFQVSGGLVDFKRDSSFTEFRTGLLIDRRDNVFDPQRGFLAQVAVRERGRLFQADGEFLQVTAEGRWFLPLPLNSVLGMRALGGSIVELGTSGGVPPIERFFAGGLNSVRGWKLDDLGPKGFDADKNAYVPVGGLSRLMGSLEVRTRLLTYLGTAVFLDVGKVGRETYDLLPTDLGWAIGCGLRFLTPVGPLRFDVGYRLSDDPTAAKRVQYHLSLGQAF